MNSKLRMRKRDLEIFIEGIEDPISPIPRLEQYPITSRVAANMLWDAHFHNDIYNCTIADLGCGSGKLSLACLYLGAAHVTGIDIDSTVIKLAQANSKLFNLQNRVSWVCGDIEILQTTSHFDMVIMNPPFGIRGVERDIRFLFHAMQISNVIYSLHLGRQKNRTYISAMVENRGFKIDIVSRLTMDIPHLFSFHQKRIHPIEVDFYRIIKSN